MGRDLEATVVVLDQLSADDALAAMRVLGQPVDELDRAAHDAGFRLEISVRRDDRDRAS